jgi:deoxyribodipyrimidine photo-lyase
VILFWHRRDLRLPDNAGLAAALETGQSVLSLFIFDRTILDDLPADDARVTYIHDAVTALSRAYAAHGGTLLVRYGRPLEVLQHLIEEFPAISALYTNEDYEPYAATRDAAVTELLASDGRAFRAFKDQVIFAKDEVLSKSGTVHRAFGMYRDTWLARLTPEDLAERPSATLAMEKGRLYVGGKATIPTLEAMGFQRNEQHPVPDGLPEEGIVRNYHKTRDLPGHARSTTRASVHLRFGTLSPREVMRQAKHLNETLWHELIWRDYFTLLLWKFPQTVEETFAPSLRRLPWRNDEAEFQKWCAGQTGYPFIDAGMRELNATGFMQNRARMATASFLVKHLLIDWRWGERYFAEKLLDFDLSQNIGNWQWVAGTGVVNAPWFRVFSPQSQLEKFDPELQYVKRWIPEYGTREYPAPMVDHKMARERALATYKATTAEARE